MTMASERTVWAEGMGFSQELVEALTKIAEEATQRCRVDERATEQPDLMSPDLSRWASELERFGFDDLAERVRDASHREAGDPCPDECGETLLAGSPSGNGRIACDKCHTYWD